MQQGRAVARAGDVVQAPVDRQGLRVLVLADQGLGQQHRGPVVVGSEPAGVAQPGNGREAVARAGAGAREAEAEGDRERILREQLAEGGQGFVEAPALHQGLRVLQHHAVTGTRKSWLMREPSSFTRSRNCVR